MVKESAGRGGLRLPGVRQRGKGARQMGRGKTFEPAWLRGGRAAPQLPNSVLQYLQQLVSHQSFGLVSGPNQLVGSIPASRHFTAQPSGRPGWQQARTAHAGPAGTKNMAQQAFPGKENIAAPYRHSQQWQQRHGAQQQQSRGVRKTRRGGKRRSSDRRRASTRFGIFPPPAPLNTNSYLYAVHRPAGDEARPQRDLENVAAAAAAADAAQDEVGPGRYVEDVDDIEVVDELQRVAEQMADLERIMQQLDFDGAAAELDIDGAAGQQALGDAAAVEEAVLMGPATPVQVRE